MRYAVRFTNLEVLGGVARRRSWRRYPAAALFLLAIAALCTAQARPHVSRFVTQNRATVILVIDVSGSMQAQDVRPSRLAAAESAVQAFIRLAPKQLRIGLIAFAGEPQVLAPPTTDHALVTQSLADLGFFPGFGGTAIGDALAAAVQLGQQAVGGNQNPAGGQTIAYVTGAPAPVTTHSPVSILFMSDGSQTHGDLSPLQGAQKAKAAGIPVYTIALGTPNGTLRRGFGPFAQSIPVPPDPDTLRAIAQTTGGRFFAARSSEALHSAYTSLGSSLGRTPGHTEITYLFVVAAAALLLLAGLLSALWAPRLP
jgi:Ca-activated chloride channel family protein